MSTIIVLKRRKSMCSPLTIESATKHLTCFREGELRFLVYEKAVFPNFRSGA